MKSLLKLLQKCSLVTHARKFFVEQKLCYKVTCGSILLELEPLLKQRESFAFFYEDILHQNHSWKEDY